MAHFPPVTRVVLTTPKGHAQPNGPVRFVSENDAIICWLTLRSLNIPERNQLYSVRPRCSLPPQTARPSCDRFRAPPTRLQAPTRCRRPSTRRTPDPARRARSIRRRSSPRRRALPCPSEAEPHRAHRPVPTRSQHTHGRNVGVDGRHHPCARPHHGQRERGRVRSFRGDAGARRRAPPKRDHVAHHPPTCWQAHPPTSTPSVDACVSTAGGVAAVTAGCAPQCVRVPPRVRLSPSAPASHSPPASRTAAPLAGGTPTTVNTAPSFVDATTSYLQHRCNASGLESEASEATHVRTAARRTPPKRNRIAAHRRSPAAATCLQEHPPSSTGDATMCRSSNEGGVDPVDGERAGDGPPEPEVLALADPRHRSRGERMRTARLKRESGSVSSVRAPST